MLEINYDLLEPYRAELIAFKIDLLRASVNYYKNSFLPDFREYSPISQNEALTRAEEKLAEFIRDSRQQTPIKYMGFQRSEILNCLRSNAIKERQTAVDHNQNPFIVIRCLKRAVNLANLLKKLEPQLEIYSNKWLCRPQAITLK
ncbi:hypothetical protein [Flavobacterium mekongense]|uniref:hypothetical protein n=1 Tax=Flavobacterium mekongense TaxID=3379707 RepID=UPI0039994C9F